MATPYSDIYDCFLSRVTDYGFLSLIDSDKEDILCKYMILACAKFNRLCKVDLSDRDDEAMIFNNSLSDEIIDIITTGMVVEWLKPKYYFDDHLRNVLNTNDYKLASSPANMLSAIRETYKETNKEFKAMMREYSFNHKDKNGM